MSYKYVLSPDMLKVFETVPDLYLILSPDLHILTASNAYLTATHTIREEITGKYLFEVFPENPAVPEANLVSNLQASFQKIRHTGKPHQMDVQRYDLPHPSEDGFEEKYWNPLNTPVLDEEGNMLYIIHKVSDAIHQIKTRQKIQDLTDREQMALREADWERQNLQEILAQAPVAIGIFEGQSHKIVLANARMREMAGKTSDELLGKPVFEALPEAAGQGFESILDEVFSTGKSFEAREIQATGIKDGKVVSGYFNTVYQALRNARQEISGVIQIVTDVTEQVTARKKVEDSERQLRLITDSIPALVGYLDREEKYRFANLTYQHWFHQNPQALLGVPVREVVGEKAYQVIKKNIDRALAGERLDYEARMPYREGFVKHIRASYIPDIQQGEVAGFFTLLTDITEQVEAQQKIEMLNRELEDRVAIRTQELEKAQYQIEAERMLLQEIFNQAPVAMGYFEGDELVVISANQLLCNMWGYTPEQVLGRPLLEGIPELKGQGFDEMLTGVLTTGVPYVGNEVAAQLQHDGQLDTKYFNFVYQPLYDAKGKISGVVDVAIDVTELVLARREVEEREKKLQILNDELAFTNDELHLTNRELAEAKKALERLNNELEDRVAERTQSLKLAQQETERQRQVLHSLFMEAPAPIVILDGEDLVFQLVNPAYQQIFPGRPLLGKALVEALPELEETSIPNILTQVYQTGKTYVAQEMPLMLARHQESSLEEIYWTFTYQARRNEHGAVDGILVFAYEVTEQVKARRILEEVNRELEERVDIRTQELQLARAEAESERRKLYDLFMQAPALICIFQGPEHVFHLVNPQYQRLVGDRHILGKPIAEAMPELDGQPIFKLLDDVYRTGENFHAHEMLVQLDHDNKGELGQNYYNFIYQPTRNLSGDIDGILVFAYEVTNQVVARKQVEQSEVQLKILNQELAATNEEVQEANEQLLLTQQTLEQLNATLEEKVRQRTEQLEKQKREVQQLNQELESANEELQVANENVLASNEDLANSNRQLSYINADMDNFIYTASHDLKAPISNIEGLMTALMRNLSEENQQMPIVQKVSGMIASSIERFKKTLDELTQITKLQREENHEDVIQVDLSRIIHEVTLDLASPIEQADAQFDIDLQGCSLIRFSAKNARSIVYNLISNAIKYRSSERQVLVRVSCYTEGGYLVLVVEDNGLGIDASDEDKIFAMFKRLHDHVEGTGVGLYIVKKIIENAGGKIEVQSKLGQGTTFRVYFKHSDKRLTYMKE